MYSGNFTVSAALRNALCKRYKNQMIYLKICLNKPLIWSLYESTLVPSYHH